jgi:hypothetical protein
VDRFEARPGQEWQFVCGPEGKAHAQQCAKKSKTRNEKRASHRQTDGGRGFLVKKDEGLDPSLLPEGLHVEHERLLVDGNIVQWAIVSSADTIYVVFKGTDNVTDCMIDGSVITCDTPHGLRVHSGMWNALQQSRNDNKHHTLKCIIGVLRELLSGRSEGKEVVLCGHSLGGGYAILTSLELIANEIEVAAVLTFGAPQVIVPNQDLDIWHKLDSCTILFINAFDPVPRLPSILAKRRQGFQIFKGPLIITVGVDHVLKHSIDTILDYDTVGTLMFISAGSSYARRVCSTDKDHREILGSLPDPLDEKQHFMDQYLSILAKN